MTRKTFFLLGWLTLIGFSSLGGIIIEKFLDVRFFSIFTSSFKWYYQVLIGLAYGVLAALAGWQIIKTPMLNASKQFFSDLIQVLNLKICDIIFISLCAGTGEEILFRGAIQPYLGIWVTAILFVAIHGYLNPMNWKLSIYGFFMCFVIAGMGYLCAELGIVTAISAHFAIDVILLSALVKK